MIRMLLLAKDLDGNWGFLSFGRVAPHDLSQQTALSGLLWKVTLSNPYQTSEKPTPYLGLRIRVFPSVWRSAHGMDPLILRTTNGLDTLYRGLLMEWI